MLQLIDWPATCKRFYRPGGTDLLDPKKPAKPMTYGRKPRSHRPADRERYLV